MGGFTFPTHNYLYADLHIHSIYSDGSLTPHEIVRTAQELNLQAISITDHDTISGVDETIQAARGELEVIPAVEFSSNIGDLDIHILGYYVDCNDGDLLAYLETFKKHRVERVKRMIEKLAHSGVRLEFEQIKVMARNCSLGRPHIAEVLVENGYARSINDAFTRYLGYHTPYYIPKMNIHPRDVLQKIRKCNGISVLAHCGTVGEPVIYELIMHGVNGIEVWHPDHSESLQQKLSEIAIKNGLLMTGGSDCHGRIGCAQIGCTGCDVENVRQLKAYRTRASDAP